MKQTVGLGRIPLRGKAVAQVLLILLQTLRGCDGLSCSAVLFGIVRPDALHPCTMVLGFAP